MPGEEEEPLPRWDRSMRLRLFTSYSDLRAKALAMKRAITGPRQARTLDQGEGEGQVGLRCGRRLDGKALLALVLARQCVVALVTRSKTTTVGSKLAQLAAHRLHVSLQCIQ